MQKVTCKQKCEQTERHVISNQQRGSTLPQSHCITVTGKVLIQSRDLALICGNMTPVILR